MFQHSTTEMYSVDFMSFVMYLSNHIGNDTCVQLAAFNDIATHCAVDEILRFFLSSEVKCHYFWFTTIQLCPAGIYDTNRCSIM
jgi:hypothetical protein